MRASTLARACSGWLPGTSSAIRAWPRPPMGRRARAGTSPARSSDDLPEPEGPYITSRRVASPCSCKARKRCQSSSISLSRPKKRSPSLGWNDSKPW